MIFREATAG